MLAAAGHFHLGAEVRDQVQQRADAAKEREYNASLKKKDEYDALFVKVQEIQNLNLPYDKWNAVQLKLMVKWFKRDGDEKLPNKKQDLVARYLATCHRGDLPAPMLPNGFEAAVAPPITENAADVPPTADNAALVPPVLETDEEEVVARILLGAASSRIEQETVAVAATSV